MNKYRTQKRRNSIIVCTIICIVAFALLLSFSQNALLGRVSAGLPRDADFIKFVDVGQGDCAIIYSNGYCAVVDVGEPEEATTVNKALKDYGIVDIDALIISHLHSDHVGALPEIAELYPIQNLFMPKIYNKSIITAKIGKETAVQNGAAFYEVDRGINFQIGEFEITILSDYDGNLEENDRSVFVMAEIDNTKILFTGDAETKTENKLLEDNINIDCDILKVSHHGSNTSSSERFLSEATPDYAVISVGKGNSYSHPHTETLKSLKKCGAKILRTDNNGDITFDFTDDNIELKTEK
jgi:competence protein ComEC